MSERLPDALVAEIAAGGRSVLAESEIDNALRSLAEEVRQTRAAKLQSHCECGAPLPTHLAALGLTAHVCSCWRRYRVELGVFLRDGTEMNPFGAPDPPAPGV